MPRPNTPVVDPRMLPDVARSAEASMVDSCVIRGPGGARTYDPVTKRTSAAAGAVKRTGGCYVQPQTAQPLDTQLGGEVVQARGYLAAVPLDWDDVANGDIFEVTVAVSDPRLTGREFTVADVTVDTFGVQRNLELEETGRG